MGDLPHSFIMLLPDSSYCRTGGKMWIMRFQNWPLGYEIQKSVSYSKTFINDCGGVNTCPQNFWHSSLQETQLHSLLPEYGLDLVICFSQTEYGKGIRLTWEWRNLAGTPLIKQLRLRVKVTLTSHSQGWLHRCATCVDTGLHAQKGPALDLMFSFWHIEILHNFISELVCCQLNAMGSRAGVWAEERCMACMATIPSIQHSDALGAQASSGPIMHASPARLRASTG